MSDAVVVPTITISGSGSIDQSSIADKNSNSFLRLCTERYSFIEQVTAALREAGLLTAWNDFTKSNKRTGKRSFNNQSLHAIGDRPNPYEQAIAIDGKARAPFNEDNVNPYFGFGDATTHDKEMVSFLIDCLSRAGSEACNRKRRLDREEELMRKIYGLKAHYNPIREREVWEICKDMTLIDTGYSSNLRREFISLLEVMCNKRVTCRANYVGKVEGAKGSIPEDNTFIPIFAESFINAAAGVREPVGDSNTHSPTANLMDISKDGHLAGDRSNNDMHVQQYTLPDNPYTAHISISVAEETGLHSPSDEIDESSGNPPNPVPNSLPYSSISREQFSVPDNPHTAPISNTVGDVELGLRYSNADVDESSGNPPNPALSSPPHSSNFSEEGQSSRANGGVGGHSPPSQRSGGAGGNSPPPQGTGGPDLVAEHKERRSYIPAMMGGSIAITVLVLSLYSGMPTRENPASRSKADKIKLGMVVGPQILVILLLCLYMMRCHPAQMPRIFNTAVGLFIVGLLTVVAEAIFLMF